MQYIENNFKLLLFLVFQNVLTESSGLFRNKYRGTLNKVVFVTVFLDDRLNIPFTLGTALNPAYVIMYRWQV